MHIIIGRVRILLIGGILLIDVINGLCRAFVLGVTHGASVMGIQRSSIVIKTRYSRPRLTRERGD